MWITVLLIFLAGASIIGYIHYQTPRTGNTFVIKKQSKSSSDIRVVVRKIVRRNRSLSFADETHDWIQIH